MLAEFFEAELDSRGLNLQGLNPNELRQVFVRFLLNEVMQRETLLTVLGGNSIVKPNFDFTANRRLYMVFSLFDTNSGLAQCKILFADRWIFRFTTKTASFSK